MMYSPKSRVFRVPNLSIIMGFNCSAELKEQQRLLFQSGMIRNPQLLHHNLVEYDVDKVIRYYKDFLKSEGDRILSPVLKIAIESLIKTQIILKSSIEKDWVEFNRGNIDYYGDIDTNLWHFIQLGLDETLNKATKYPQLKNQISYLMENIHLEYDSAIAQKVRYELSEELPDQVTRSIMTICGNSISIDLEKQYTTKELIPIFEKALQEYGISGWAVKFNYNFEGITVSSNDQVIYLPTKKTYSGLYLQKLISHEIGVHVQRSFNSSQRNSELLRSSKLSNLEEEGLAMVVENTLYPSDRSGSTSFLGVALAAGMDGRKRDFRDLFEILVRYYQIRNELRGKNIRVQDLAWSRCIKTFMGTDYKTPGICLFRTKGYLEKEYYTLRYLHENPDSFEFIMNNKYDYLNSELDSVIRLV